MSALLTAIAAWLVIGFGLPAADHLPAVAFATPQEIASLRYQPLIAAGGRITPAADSGVRAEQRRQIVSVYDSRRRTIVLPEGWRGATPAELSILVHEMVHHLQHEAGWRYACPEEREQLAYAAQEQVLGVFGRSLASEFQIDRLTLRLTTGCYY